MLELLLTNKIKMFLPFLLLKYRICAKNVKNSLFLDDLPLVNLFVRSFEKIDDVKMEFR